MAEPCQHHGRFILETRRQIMRPINLQFEAFDFCPLKCNSCPQGRREHQSTYWALDPGMLESALKRIRAQREIEDVALIGWGEPLMNKALPDLIRIAKRYGIVWVSTTGNYWACDLEDLARSAPQRFSVSISGMTQETHLKHHEGGDIEKAKAFMERMAGYGMRFSIIFHRYNNNLHEEPAGREFARRLGLKWEGIWGRHHAVEDLIAGKSNPYMLVNTPDQLAEAKKWKDRDCPLQTNHLAIDAKGDVRGCVVATERGYVGNIFKDTVDQILERKLSYHLCDPCYKAGVNKIVCSQTIEVDALYASRTPGSVMDRWRWFVERSKKRVWLHRG